MDEDRGMGKRAHARESRGVLPLVARAIPLLVGVCLATVAAAQPLPSASPTEAFQHVLVLSQQIGSRPAGTPAYERATEYIAQQLERYGYTVERESFPFRFFDETRPPVLTTLAPARTDLHPFTLVYSAPTPTEGVEGELEPAGLGREDDLRGKRLDGRVALIERGQIFFRAKVANAAAAGALAAIIYNNRPGPVQQGTLLEESKIPAVTISNEEGQRLLQGLRAGPLRMRLQVSSIVGQRMAQNVIGVKLGTRTPKEIVVVGAHADSVKVSPGANDNGSGVAAVLEAARVLAHVATARTIHFVAFGAEENGLIGSHFYTLSHAGTIVGMINMDMVGRGPGLQVGNEGPDISAVDLAERVALRQGMQVRRFKLGQSDHVSFEQAGVPSVFITTGDDNAIHTPGDTADRLNPTLVASAATLAAAVAQEMATSAR